MSKYNSCIPKSYPHYYPGLHSWKDNPARHPNRGAEWDTNLQTILGEIIQAIYVVTNLKHSYLY